MMGPSALVAFLLCLPGVAEEPGTRDLADEAAAADEKLLREQKVGTDGPGLIAFLRQRTLTPDDQKRIAELIRNLGDDRFEERQAASTGLRRCGTPALAALREAARHPDLEVSRRAQECIEAIESGPGTGLPMAACRRLARLAPAGAAETLLGYAPFADDDAVEEEVCAALLTVTPRGRPGAAVQAALTDALPARRAAAAFVASRADDVALRDRVAGLLADRDGTVRFRAAQGLLAARDRRAVKTLVDLLGDGPEALAWRAEEYLLRLAGDNAPLGASSGSGTPDDRKKWRDAWCATQGDKLDLARAEQVTPFLRHILIPEMHGGRIREVGPGPDNKPLWELRNGNMPRDAQVLPGGRVLVCECGNVHRVAEYEIRSGKLLWSHPVNDPAYAQRLANGNTFIATHNDCCEVTPKGLEVYKHTAEHGFFIHSTHRMANGHIVWLSMTGTVRELSPDGKQVRQLDLPQARGGNWSGVEGLPGNRYLAVELNQGRVIEVDAKGVEQWSCQIAGACYASRLPTGNTLVCSFGGQRIVEVDRQGKSVREVKLTTSPWRAHAR
jgi:hypothetical protein